MADNERILAAIYAAIDEVNPRLPRNLRMTKSMDTVLYGRSGGLDSLGLVALIVAIQGRLQELGVDVNLADERTLSQEHSPFQNVRTLAEYVALRMDEAGRT